MNNIILLFILIIVIYFFFISKEGFDNTQNKTLTYEEFKKLHLNVDLAQRKIPRVVFRTGPFKLNKAPKEIEQNLQDLLDKNPGYIQVYFDDNDRRNFIQEFFPEYLPEYDVLIPGAFQADLWRLLVIYKYGGIYNDMGNTYIIPIDEIIKEDDNIILCAEDLNYYINKKCNLEECAGVSNTFIASYPKSDLIKYFIDNVIDNIRNRIRGSSQLSITGPHTLGMSLNKYLDNPINSQIKRSIITDKFGNKIKIFEFVMYEWKDPNNHILNVEGIKCILTKFPNYYNVMYDNRNVLHYSRLWEMNNVYHNKM